MEPTFFFLLYFQYVSLTINKFQFLVLCLLKSGELNKNLKCFFLLGSLFLFPLGRLGYIKETELTVSLKHKQYWDPAMVSLANVLSSYWSKQFKTLIMSLLLVFFKLH